MRLFSFLRPDMEPLFFFEDDLHSTFLKKLFEDGDASALLLEDWGV